LIVGDVRITLERRLWEMMEGQHRHPHIRAKASGMSVTP